MTAMAINEEKPPNPIFPKIVGKAKQRDRGEAGLRGNDVELEILDLILLAALAF